MNSFERDNNKELNRFEYPIHPIERGYNNRTLYIDISDNKIVSKPVTDEMKRIFTGGRGFGLWLLWNAIKEKTKWNDPANEICIACGPLGGTTLYPGSGKSIVITISPLTQSVMDSNVGGYFGPYLKFAGWDAMEIQGKADNDIIITIDGDRGIVRIVNAEGFPEDSHLLGAALADRYSEGNLRAISTVSAGSGAEHTLMGCLNFSWYDKIRKTYRYKQAGRGGTGTVFRDKNIRAIVTKFSKMVSDINHPADFERLKKGGRAYTKEIRTLDPKQNEMAKVGTTHLINIMNDYDLLPTTNFRFGSHPDALNLGKEVYRKKFHPGFDGCWFGCSVACSHGVKDFTLKTGPYKGQSVWVDGPEYETIAGCGANWGIFDPDFVIEANFYCDTYGLDTISVATATAFTMECYTLKGPQHDEAWLIFLDMVNNFMPTFEQKAEALWWFPMWRTWFGLNGLCKLPWNDIVPEDNKGTPDPAKVMKHVQWYAEYFSAVTGVDVSPDDLIEMSERVYNFQRIFNLRQGFGTREHDSIPYRAMGPVTKEEYESRKDRYDTQLKEFGILDPDGKSPEEKLEALRKYREDRYEKLKDATYKRRGWTPNGIPTVEKVKGLGIDFPDVVELISEYQ